ncbi:MAG TPA: SDR family oxidoreductase [Stellaceae bacterium]|nr:SDR family oxidoreductase [Stellaceae bacterium]
MTDTLNGKVAIVTGGGRGLGRSMVLGLARAGAAVVAMAARERQEIERVAAAAKASTGKDSVVPLVADVTREDDCRRAVATAIERFGALHLVVNNAGRGMKYVSETFMSQPTRFWEAAPDAWRMVIDTNVNGPFLMARAAAPHLIAAGWGRIVNISMAHSTMRRAGFSPYGPSKAALESETIIWAQDLAGTGVTVNALLPGGATRTGMISASFPEALRTGLLDPDVIVPPLLWLASARSDGVTGQRFTATRWRDDLPADEAARAACEHAGWPEGGGA